jgi:hypothetical protein
MNEDKLALAVKIATSSNLLCSPYNEPLPKPIALAAKPSTNASGNLWASRARGGT